MECGCFHHHHYRFIGDQPRSQGFQNRFLCGRHDHNLNFRPVPAVGAEKSGFTKAHEKQKIKEIILLYWNFFVFNWN
jgi:hypothetical protein